VSDALALTDRDRLEIEVEIEVLEFKARRMRERLGGSITAPREPARPLRAVRGPTKVVPPSDDELARATPLIIEKVARSAHAKGIVKP
jgi:hypothetical protein